MVRDAEEYVTDHCVISIVLQQCLPVAAAEIVDGSFCAELHTYTHACTHTHTHTHTGRPSQPEQIKMSICQFLQCIAGLLLLLLFGLYLKCVSVLVSKTALSSKFVADTASGLCTHAQADHGTQRQKATSSVRS